MMTRVRGALAFCSAHRSPRCVRPRGVPLSWATVLLSGGLVATAGALDAARPPIQAPASGQLRGTVIVTPVPPPGTLKVTTDQAVCGDAVPDDSLLVDLRGGVANAVILVSGVPAPAGAPPPVVTNHQCRFVPRVTLARPGTNLTITSDDRTLHTTHAYLGDAQSLFNIALPIPGLKIVRPLPRAAGRIRLACDAHPWMRGYVVVTDELAAISGPDGTFVLEEVPAGTRELRLWHERLGDARQTVTVPAGGTGEVRFALKAP